MRTKSVSAIVTFIFIFLGLGLFNLEVLQQSRFKDLSSRNCIRLISQPGARGRILDRNGEIIVDSYLSYDLMILPQAKDKVNNTLEGVSDILGIRPEELKKRFKQGYLAPFLPVTIAKNIPVRKAIAIEELKFDLPNIIIQPRPLRDYPYGKLASHVVGYLSEIDHWRLTKLADYGYKTKDVVGYTGLEEKYDYYLREKEGAFSIEVDHQGRAIRMLGFRSPGSGKDLRLSLDLRIQKIIEESLIDRKGSVVIMDPYSGEIVAMASSPNFNPSVFIDKSAFNIDDLFSSPEANLMNRATAGTYPPGSVFKLIVATAALETRKIIPSTTFSCPGSIMIGKQKFACWDTHGQENLIQAITHSCNVFFYRTGLLVKAQLIHDYAVKFGFSKPTGIDLPYESVGFVPSPLWRKIYKFQNWFDGDTANFSIGQGYLLVTPIQIARMMAVFANKGFLVNPYLVQAVDNQDFSVYQKKVVNLHFKESTINLIREGLRNVVSDAAGTANILASLQVTIAGKTGTAEVTNSLAHGWFAGFFPFNKPRFVICVFLEHGGSGQAACMLTKQILEKMIVEDLI